MCLNSDDNLIDYIKVRFSDNNININENQINKFLLYKDLLKEWNQKINLTRITDDEEIIVKHFVDSACVLLANKIKENSSLIDIGTGAGFPGIPLKIIKPNIKVVLLDSLKKRLDFIEDLLKHIGFNDIELLHGRAEDYAKKPEYRERFDICTSRAVSQMRVLCEYCLPYLKLDGFMIAMKGDAIQYELDDAQNALNKLGGEPSDVLKYKLYPNIRHSLVCIKKVRACPDIYPRKAGTAQKKPL